MNFNDADSIYTYTFEAEKKVRNPDIDSHNFEHIIVKFILCYTCMYPTCICASLLQSQIQVGEKL